MNILLLALLAAFLAPGDEPNTASAPKKRPVAASQSSGDKAAEIEYEKLLEKDEAVLDEMEKLFDEFDRFAEKGAVGQRGALLAKIDSLADGMKKAYEDFLRRNPKDVDGRLAYGSFLNEIGEEEEAVRIWEKARVLDPKNPSAWNNIANHYGHRGPVKKAFHYYEKAIELDPKEPVYLQNLATTVYLFRKDAAEAYRIDETEIFNKALDLYRQAMKLDPANLLMATEYARSYYGIRPLRAEEAIGAWNHCLGLAKNEAAKQGVHLHLARVHWMAGKLTEAQKHLDEVKQPDMQQLKERIQRNIDRGPMEDASSAKEEEAPGAKPEERPVNRRPF